MQLATIFKDYRGTQNIGMPAEVRDGLHLVKL